MHVTKFCWMALCLCFLASCGRTDFDPNFLPDGGLPDADGDVDSDTDGTTPGCGNGILEAQLGEICDEGDRNSDTPGAVCRTNCLPARCGDGILDPGEICDESDRNSDTPGAVCRTNCLPARCGDGILDPDESCDEGVLNSSEPGAPCRNNCVLPTCGDGIVDPGEECDDANTDPQDACTNACTNARCGDGVIFTGQEICDDGNTLDDIDCDADCQTSCGDSELEPARGELCDDGTANSDTQPAACRTDCRFARCGDGIVDEGQFCLGAPLHFPVGAPVTDVASLDVDADGYLDVVTVTETSVHVFLYHPATDSFIPVWSRSGLASPVSPISEDFNGDGIVDLAVLETTQRRVAILNGQGGGQFSAPVRYSTGTGTPARAVAADFTGDGRPEIAVIIPYANLLRILRNNGSGTFSLLPAISTCTRPISIATGKLDEDESADIVIACQSANVVSILYGNGNGTFSTPAYLGASDKPTHIVLADMNHDNQDDIVVLRSMIYPTMPQLSLYLQTANRTFTMAGLVTNLPYNARMGAVADADRNRTKDVLVAFDNALWRYINDSNGNLTFSLSYSWPSNPERIAYADFRGDMEAIPIIAGGTVGGAVGLDFASWPLPSSFLLPAIPLWVDLAKINGDTHADGVFITTDGRLLVLSGTGTGTFLNLIEQAIPANSEAALFFENSHPGAADIWLIQNATGEMLPLLNDGTGNFTLGTAQPVAGAVVRSAISHLDFNRDAYEDAAVLFKDTARIQLFRGAATGAVPGISLPVGTSPEFMRCGNILGMGNTECVVVDASGAVYLFISDMAGSGTVISIGSLPELPTDIALADADNDHQLDLLAAFAASSTVSVHRFTIMPGPTVTLTAGETLALPVCTPRQLIPSDMDHNGLFDTLVLCDDSLTLRMLTPQDSNVVLHPTMRTALDSLERCVSGTLLSGGEFLCWSDRPAAITLLQRH